MGCIHITQCPAPGTMSSFFTGAWILETVATTLPWG